MVKVPCVAKMSGDGRPRCCPGRPTCASTIPAAATATATATASLSLRFAFPPHHHHLGRLQWTAGSEPGAKGHANKHHPTRTPGLCTRARWMKVLAWVAG